MCDKDLLMPCFWNAPSKEAEPIHRRNFQIVMGGVELLDGQQFAGKLVVSPVNVSYHIIKITTHPRQHETMIALKDLERWDRRGIVVEIKGDEANRRRVLPCREIAHRFGHIAEDQSGGF